MNKSLQKIEAILKYQSDDYVIRNIFFIIKLI